MLGYFRHASTKLKPLSEQVIVITGASSGIGLATARKAVRAGAAVVLAGRNEHTLHIIHHELISIGGRATYAVADVGDEAAVAAIVETAVNAYGGFDTWINNAGVSVRGQLSDLTTADHERLFKTDYWGTVFGSLAAIKHFRERGIAGAVINIGSLASDISFPLMTAHSATKHAIRGYTDALRLEVMAKREPISITLIKPSTIATPGIHQHGRKLENFDLRVPPPVYAPNVVADAILHAATHRVRDIAIGSSGLFMRGFARHLPRVFDRLLAAATEKLRRPPRATHEDTLYEPGSDCHAQGKMAARNFSLTTKAQMHPLLTVGGVFAVGGLALFASRRLQHLAYAPTASKKIKQYLTSMPRR